MHDTLPLRRFVRAEIFGDQAAPIYVRRTRHDTGHLAHDHEFFEVVIVVQGSAGHAVPGGERTIRRGDVIFLRPGSWHGYERCRDFLIWNCCFGTELLRHELAWLMDDARLAALLWGEGLPDGSGHAISVFSLSGAALKRSLREAEALEDSLAAGRTRIELAAQLALLLAGLAAAAPLPPPRAARHAHPAVLKCMRRMEAALAHPWTLGQLARDAGLSPEHLIRCFRGATGLTPLSYLARCRSERAAGLLARSDEPVANIGARVGWDSPCHFARSFHRHFGMSATTYRKKHAR